MSGNVERAQVLEALGYTPRQAAFLAMVTMHGGYFLRRQYVAFIGGSHGRATVRFLAAAASRGHVQALPYGRNGHVFHLCARPVYAAVGQEHNRNCRPAEWAAVVRKLMTLDFVLEHRDATFWATEEDKVALFEELGIRRELWPARQYPPRHGGSVGSTRYFVDKMPWFRMPSEPRLWCAYIDAERTIGGFKTFLQQYASLLEATAAGVVHVSTGAWRGPVDQTPYARPSSWTTAGSARRSRVNAGQSCRRLRSTDFVRSVRSLRRRSSTNSMLGGNVKARRSWTKRTSRHRARSIRAQ